MLDAGKSLGVEDADYRDLLEFVYLAPVGIIKFELDGTIAMANPAAAQFLMPMAADGGMTNLYALFAHAMPDLRHRIDRFRYPNGRILEDAQFAVPGAPLVMVLGVNKIDASTFMAVVQDVTRLMEQEARIRADHTRLSAILDHVHDHAIYTANIDGRVDDWNRSLRRQGGWEADDILGRPIDIFFPPGPEGHASAASLLERARMHGHDEYEGHGIRKDGHAFWSSTVATALPDRDGRAKGFVLITRDLAERKAKEDALVALATTDPLTGARNRRAGRIRLEEAFRRWRRYGSSFALLMIDCDHFKSVNDRWGHDVGDAVLIALMRRCQETLRDTDIAIRWGGEEFLIVLPEIGSEAAMAVAERLRGAIQETEIRSDDQTIKVTVSIGVTQIESEDRVPDDVVHRADRALYLAKRNGRNRTAGL
jgi:diguanylate cyclase (GGDEF)-like protein/PAS domain S-box-containing protein